MFARMVVGMAVVFGLAGVVFLVGLFPVVEFAGGGVVLQLFPGTAHYFPESVGGVTWCPLVTSLLLAPNVSVTNHAAQPWFISDETAVESTSRFQTAGGHSYNILGIHSKNHGKFLVNISD